LAHALRPLSVFSRFFPQESSGKTPPLLSFRSDPNPRCLGPNRFPPLLPRTPITWEEKLTYSSGKRSFQNSSLSPPRTLFEKRMRLCGLVLPLFTQAPESPSDWLKTFSLLLCPSQVTPLVSCPVLTPELVQFFFEEPSNMKGGLVPSILTFFLPLFTPFSPFRAR